MLAGDSHRSIEPMTDNTPDELVALDAPTGDDQTGDPAPNDENDLSRGTDVDPDTDDDPEVDAV